MSGRIIAVVLAAGGSTRMRPVNKLLAPYRGAPLLLGVVDELACSSVDEVCVVIPNDAGRIRSVLEDRAVRVVENADPGDGMSSSLRAGLDALPPDTAGVLVALGDMPLVRAAHVDALLRQFVAGGRRGIVAPSFGGRRGHPVVFGIEFLAELRALRGDVGAREVLRRHQDRVSLVPVEDDGVLYDVDTTADLERLDRPD